MSWSDWGKFIKEIGIWVSFVMTVVEENVGEKLEGERINDYKFLCSREWGYLNVLKKELILCSMRKILVE